jgi:uncharacterized membrane protein (UPF0136 family)
MCGVIFDVFYSCSKYRKFIAFLMLYVGYLKCQSSSQGLNTLHITARRYVLVSVTRRQHRHKSVPVGQKTVTAQGGFGAVFGIQVQIFVRTTRVAVQV